MNNSIKRRAGRAGLIVKKCRRGSILIDPTTGASVYDGNRSTKSWHKEREIESFLRRKERGGIS
jgi:hypothetical protein